ncbi:SH3 domain-containing protein [Pseudoflavonifractor sp. 524-17]|uniref:SH3 domain-containing protein n=1 Tax=Pseudoflavonifractor sp. 524-17 TaxID=2304577 RepID=UPI00137B4AFD|nr:SH3 domain-containing protein [Pseudoflavonifractor sp. 524-17]NCE64103.1 SH3 domain-containing protein [Pseudoflavonifractor sp. 524-17]
MQNNSKNRAPRSNAKEAPVKPPVPEKLFTGVVTDCLRLNVRKEPRAGAEVVAVINALSQVAIDMEGSTELFCKVRTPDGIEGFCMKKYIQLRRSEKDHGA